MFRLFDSIDNYKMYFDDLAQYVEKFIVALRRYFGY